MVTAAWLLLLLVSACGVPTPAARGAPDRPPGAHQRGVSDAYAMRLGGSEEGQAFGLTMVSLGDYDGDGRGDVAIGAPGAEGYLGHVEVHRGAAGGVQEEISTLLVGQSGGARLGSGLAAADVDGDGIRDLLVGAPVDADGAGVVYVYMGDADGYASEPSMAVIGDPMEAFGERLARAGDVNGDGYEDVLVGSHYPDDYGGAAWLHEGSPIGLVETASTTFAATTGMEFLGAGLAGIGDVDADGYDDVAIGAPGWPDGQFVGRISFYPGGRSGLVERAFGTFEGRDASDQVGYSVVGAGDVDGDGFADVVASAAYAGVDGEGYLLTGSESGPSLTTLLTEDTASYIGMASCAAGDVDGDGYDDAFLTAMSGQAWLYQGSAKGLVAGGMMYNTSGDVAFCLSDLDLDGDGVTELLVSDPYGTYDRISSAGVVYVFTSEGGTPLDTGTGDSGTGDSGEGAGEGEGGDDTSGPAADDTDGGVLIEEDGGSAKAGGCGCDAGGPSGGGVLIAAVLLRRRRRG